MAIGSKLSVKITFDLAGSPCFFSLEDITDYASEGISSSDVLGNFVITGPLGQIYSNTSWVTPDIDLTVSPVFNLNIGVPDLGTYSFQYTVQVSGGVQPGIYTATQVINYDYGK